MEIHNEHKLIKLFEDWSGEKVTSISPLPPSGSPREYIRISGESKTAIGAYNSDEKENNAFIRFSEHFRKHRLNVPEVYSYKADENIYLQEDLGDTTLFSLIVHKRIDDSFPDELIKIYKKVIDQLPQFQVAASSDFDYSICYPSHSFDKPSMMWDLNYFKYYFLRLAKISFDEQKLEDDFHSFTNFLLETESNFFLYRDFQSRNVMFKTDEPYFIDFQGGRKGALQYDLASLLYDAKADIPQPIRDDLLDYYLEVVNKHTRTDPKVFKKFYWGFVLIRIMQAMGAYGYRGFYERKEHFLKSIPYAVKNLKWILDNVKIETNIKELVKVFHSITESQELKKFERFVSPPNSLTVRINSFSYRKGIPLDKSGNGGGFVFDCRFITNPGRFDEFKDKTGLDSEVIAFFKKDKSVEKFLENVYSMVDQSVERYLERNFTSLMVSFGCTGGQHRSVYAAENLASHLADRYDIKVEVTHIELEYLEKEKTQKIIA
ncbi:MAG: phosphotransferase [Ignavibacteriaceae bacterium]|nr:phosphotransferase [Ignavibacteriaceae bacterium]